MESTPADPSTPATTPRRPRHTTTQRAVLALNIVVVLACLVGAVALVYGKSQLDGRLQTAKVEVQTSVATVPVVTAAPAGEQADGPAVPSRGCGVGLQKPATKEKQFLDDSDRWFLITTPDDLDADTPLPLVLDFHGLAEGADVGLATRLDALDGRPQRADDVRPFDLGMLLELDAGPQHRRPPDRAGRAADPGGGRGGDLGQEHARIAAVEAVPLLQNDLEAARQRVAEVAVADDRVQLAEVLLVVDRGPGDRLHDKLDLILAHGQHILLVSGSGNSAGAPRGDGGSGPARCGSGTSVGARCGAHARPAARNESAGRSGEFPSSTTSITRPYERMEFAATAGPDQHDRLA